LDRNVRLVDQLDRHALGRRIGARDDGRSHGHAARVARADRFVFASSGGVYAAGPGKRAESEPLAPGNFYLATKFGGELLTAAYRSFFNVICLRLFFAYGRGQVHSMFVPDLVRRVIAGEPVRLYGSEGLKANPIHVSDAAVAFQRALAIDGSYAINIAGPEVLTMRRMVQLIGNNVSRTPLLEEVGPAGTRDLVADTSLMERLLGPPTAQFEERIAEVCDEILRTVI